jgi:hypothetical protein
MASRKTGGKKGRSTGRKRRPSWPSSTTTRSPHPRELCLQKKAHHWEARHLDEITGAVDQSTHEATCYRVVGLGRTADEAIRDWQREWRECAGRRDLRERYRW